MTIAKISTNGNKNTMGKEKNCYLRAISFYPHSVFGILVLQTRKNQIIFGKKATPRLHYQMQKLIFNKLSIVVN